MKTKDFNLIQSVDFIERITDKISKAFENHDVFFGEKQLVPATNIIQIENGVILEMAISGCDKTDIQITLDKNLLTISCKKEESKQTFLRKEFTYHSFSRSFNLSDSLDKNNIKSSMNNGILKIEIAKLNPEVVKAQKKTIPVE